MSAQMTSALPTDVPDDNEPAAVEHHRLPEPDEHLCSCGRLREDCVRDAVRTMWS